MEAHIYNLQIRVLLYREDDEFVAHALELDILAYGKTEAKALSELGQLIDSQLSFAHQKKDDALLHHPAPKEFFTRWDQAQAAALKQEVLHDSPVEMEVKAVAFPLDGRIKKLPRRTFRRLQPICA